MSNTDSKVNNAAAQAISAGANPRDLEIARQYLGKKDFIGFCQSFVSKVTGGLTKGGSAIQAWLNSPNKIPSLQGIQPGDLLYFGPHSSNKGYGHTGVYSGNNQMISATNNGVTQNDLGGWLKQTGQKLLGYVPVSQRQTQTQPQPIQSNSGDVLNSIISILQPSGNKIPTPQVHANYPNLAQTLSKNQTGVLQQSQNQIGRLPTTQRGVLG